MEFSHGQMTTRQACDHAAAYGIEVTPDRVRHLIEGGEVVGRRGTRWRVDRLSWLAWVNRHRDAPRGPERPEFGPRTLVVGK